MLARLPVRTLLAAAVALLAGFVAALLVLDFAGEQLPGEAAIQIGGAYVAWVVVALVVYVLIRRIVPTRRPSGDDAGHRNAPPGESRPPGDRETP